MSYKLAERLIVLVEDFERSICLYDAVIAERRGRDELIAEAKELIKENRCAEAVAVLAEILETDGWKK